MCGIVSTTCRRQFWYASFSFCSSPHIERQYDLLGTGRNRVLPGRGRPWSSRETGELHQLALRGCGRQVLLGQCWWTVGSRPRLDAGNARFLLRQTERSSLRAALGAFNCPRRRFNVYPSSLCVFSYQVLESSVKVLSLDRSLRLCSYLSFAVGGKGTPAISIRHVVRQLVRLSPSGRRSSRSELRRKGNDRRYGVQVPRRGLAWWSGTTVRVRGGMHICGPKPALLVPTPLDSVIRAAREIRGAALWCDADRDR